VREKENQKLSIKKKRARNKKRDGKFYFIFKTGEGE
jgi:hypothetical protein